MDKVVALDIVLFDGFDGNRCCCQTRQVHRVALQQYTIEPFVFCALDATLMLYGFYANYARYVNVHLILRFKADCFIQYYVS